MEYLVWPDGVYCDPEELEEMILLGWSDDFEIVEADDDDELEREIHKICTGRYPLTA